MGVAISRQGPLRITKTTIDTAWRTRKSKQRVVVTDLECRGLALIVNPTSMTWRFDYKPRGVDPHTGKRFSSRSITIGSPETHSPGDARDTANALKGQAKAGADPASERKAKIANDARQRGNTMQRLLEQYRPVVLHRSKLRGDAGKLSTRGATGEFGYVKRAVDAMSILDKPVADISVTDLKRLLTVMAEKPATARHMFGALSRFFDWAFESGLVRANPCILLTKAHRPKPVKSRQVFHTPQQLAEIWDAIDKAEGLLPVHKDICHIFIALPCRRSEASEMDWAELNLETGVWSQAGTKTKNGDPHRIFLPPLALNILKRRHKDAGSPATGLVFPSPLAARPISTFSKIKKDIDAALETKIEWRIHDHRRSFVTALAEAGRHEAILDSILNHRQSATKGGVLGTYQRATRWPEQVKAMKAWNDLLNAAIIKHRGQNDEA
jgi:integrase